MNPINDMRPIGSAGMACSHCGTMLRPQELVATCSNCGAIFCVACRVSGAMENHVCEDNDCEDD